MIVSIFTTISDTLAPFFDPSFLSLSKLYNENFNIASIISLSYVILFVISIGEWLIAFLDDRSVAWYIRFAYLFVSAAISLTIWNFAVEFLLFVGIFLAFIVDALAGFCIAQEIKEHPKIAFLVILLASVFFYLSQTMVFSIPANILIFIKIGIIAFIVSSIWDQLNDYAIIRKNVNDFSMVIFALAIVLSLVVSIDGIGTNIGSPAFVNVIRYSLTYIQPFVYVGSLLLGLIFSAYNTKWFPIKNWGGLVTMFVYPIIFALALTYAYVGIENVSSFDLRNNFPVIYNPAYNAKAGSLGQFKGRILGPNLIETERVKKYNACIDTGIEFIPLLLESPESVIGKQATLNVRFLGEARNFEIISLDIY